MTVVREDAQSATSRAAKDLNLYAGKAANYDLRSGDMHPMRPILGRREYSTGCRSGETVQIEQSKAIILLPAVPQEVPQMDRARTDGVRLFSEIANKLSKASEKVKNAFNEYGLINVLCEYYVYTAKCNKDPYNADLADGYALISNPHFLFYAYNWIRTRKASSGIDFILSGNVTLAGILKLSDDLKTQKYKSNSPKRVYIPESNGE